jgi:TetR/AcrR family transcriptional regulator, transcriptional repressor for nem operon
MTGQSTRTAIIELAQEAIACRGYSAFSFRELATALGIKSASIHYYFPTKTDLGVAVARQYRARFQAALDELLATNPTPWQALSFLVDIYRHEAISSQRMTVCMMLAAEIKNLPGEIQVEMADFYSLNLGWIKTQLLRIGLSEAVCEETATQCFALLQGGLIGAKSQANPAYFDLAAKAMEPLLAAAIKRS